MIHYRIQSFTIYEILISLTIMSILLGLINRTINNFQYQLKISSKISESINQFYIVRSNLWRECYLSDSIHVENDTLSIYNKNSITNYFIENDSLRRQINSSTENIVNTKIRALRIFENKSPENHIQSSTIVFQLGDHCIPFVCFNNYLINQKKHFIQSFLLYCKVGLIFKGFYSY